ncbi:MAG: tRNA/rRNA cytosine-C5-methylase [Bacteroidetes bacterium]|nr:tRNA/rRNA cytosine-C5-methylase [Bacteroidota bacterium]MDA1267661.1 tRNA/rRNA cytosine-C5-methylase [Bacteroidota bacterium]
MDENQLPEAFESQMQSLLGSAEYALFKEGLALPSQTSIRLNQRKAIALPFPKQPIPWAKDGYFLEERPSFTMDPTFHAGAYYVQEASSMFISHILESQKIPKGIYLDLAAAPGGKSTLLSSYLGEDGLLVANEVIASRTQILKENIIKWGLGNTVVTHNDPEHFSPLEGFFDLVLVDAPCSGEGMFRKDPLARAEWSADHVALCSARQKRIVDKAGELVKGGGYLLYSTCTFNEKENEEILRFLTEEFAFEPVQIPLDPSWGIVETQVISEKEVFFGYRFFPHKVAGEGFFITVLRRPEGEHSQGVSVTKEFKHHSLRRVGEKESAVLEQEVGGNGTGKFYLLQDTFFRMKGEYFRELEKLTQVLSIRYFGVELGKKQGKEWIPSPEWALSLLPKNGFPKHELTLEEALDFLRKKEQSFSNQPLGWVLLSYQKLPLGWIKNLAHRVNNYYPKEWRIRN